MCKYYYLRIFFYLVSYFEWKIKLLKFFNTGISSFMLMYPKAPLWIAVINKYSERSYNPMTLTLITLLWLGAAWVISYLKCCQGSVEKIAVYCKSILKLQKHCILIPAQRFRAKSLLFPVPYPFFYSVFQYADIFTRSIYFI